MFGFIVGTLCLIGLIKVVRGRGGWRHGYGHGGYSGMRHWMLRRLYQRLDTTAGQEKVIAEVFTDLEREAISLKDEARRSRGDLAWAMRAEAFDAAPLSESFKKQKAGVEAMHKAVLEGAQKIHEVLTPQQRLVASELIENGLHGGHCGGHGRSWRRDRFSSPHPQPVQL